MLETYTDLAQRGKHLLGRMRGGQAPRQWSHYPQDDAIVEASGFQWFYHSHSQEDRSRSAEHGRIHLFARRKLWAKRLRSVSELQFAEPACGANPWVNTRHLPSIGFDAKGLPQSLFTVSS